VARQFFLGIGLSRQQNRNDVASYIVECMRETGIDSISGVATRQAYAHHPLILHLASFFDADIFSFSLDELEAQTPRLANPSRLLYSRIGCHSVAEAAALASAGIAAQLVIEKTTYQTMSFAIAQKHGAKQ